VSEHASPLDQISTRWVLIRDPEQFTLRYAPAIRKYLEAILRDPHEAAEATQEFVLKGLRLGMVDPDGLRGRFRDYLKRAVRNAALTHLRRKKPGGPLPGQLADPRADTDADREWLAEWRRCVLDRTWRRLEAHQRESPGNLAHTVLRLSVEHPDEDSDALAARAGRQSGRPLLPAAFRKQLSRARRLFAGFLVAEVAQTLEEPTAERVEEELAAVGILPVVRDFLPPDWKDQLPRG